MARPQGPLSPTTAFVFPPPRKPHNRKRRRESDFVGTTEPVTCGTGVSYGNPNASMPIGHDPDSVEVKPDKAKKRP